jgi:pSer/pThr/pTyr-binding forkhead associated (FHA) protein
VPTNPAEFFPEFAPPPPPQAPTPGVDRRTIVMAEQAPQLRKSKGRIVGWLITYSHNPDGEDFRVYAGYNRLGANPVCDIVIEDETVSGSHSIIVYRDGRCLIKDDLSRNGTFVNGQEITEAHPLQSYDQIRIGNTYLTFVAAQRIP